MNEKRARTVPIFGQVKTAWREDRVAETVTLTVPESQVIEWIRQLSPQAKLDVLRILVPKLNELEALVDYGSQRIRDLAAARDIDWDGLTESARERLIDEWLHEP